MPGGWAFTAYANREPFAVAVVRGFANEFSSIRMEDRGVYPGNALNSMIERWEDSKYIEAGHFAYLQSHGNVYGPDLEYVPSLALGVWDYRWGEKGRLQWVALGGCDTLGFPTYANGQMANHHPAPERWNDAFQGISGILGYRSASYYQPSNTVLGANVGILFVRELASGRTFYQSWISSADYLHRTLNVRAEVAAYASSREALGDTLTSFVSRRIRGIDPRSISRTMVGSGGGPHYDYCERVDNDGNPLCGRGLTDGADEPFPGLFMNCRLASECVTLPVLEVAPQSTEESVLGAIGGGLTSRVSIGSRFHSYEVTQDPHPATLLERLASAATKGAIVWLDGEALDGEGVSGLKRAVSIEGRRIPIFGDYGVSLMRGEHGADLRLSPDLKVGSDCGERTVSLSVDVVINRFSSLLESGEQIILHGAEIVYRLDDFDSPTKLVPAIVVYARVGRASLSSHIAVTL